MADSEEELKAQLSKLMKPNNDPKRKKDRSIYTRIHNEDNNPCIRVSLFDISFFFLVPHFFG